MLMRNVFRVVILWGTEKYVAHHCAQPLSVVHEGSWLLLARSHFVSDCRCAEPDRISYTTAISALAKGRKWEKALSLLSEMGP